MKKMYFSIIVSAIIFSCGVKKSKTDSHIKINSDEVSVKQGQGKSIYENNCGSCHALFPLNKMTKEGWAGIVPDMVNKVNKKNKAITITEAEQAMLLAYVSQ